jgi:hypothetical protein
MSFLHEMVVRTRLRTFLKIPSDGSCAIRKNTQNKTKNIFQEFSFVSERKKTRETETLEKIKNNFFFGSLYQHPYSFSQHHQCALI